MKHLLLVLAVIDLAIGFLPPVGDALSILDWVMAGTLFGIWLTAVVLESKIST
jgi:hypothetical protein